MHTQTASLLHHADKAFHKCRVLLGKLSEFIDDNKKVWQGFRDGEVFWILPHSLVLSNILRIRLAQNMLSSLQLALESNQRPLCKSPAQIRHHTNCVGYLFKWFEGSATFKVYQDKVDKMRMMGDGQANNQRLEQFTLARSSGARDNTMWAMSSFVQVDPDGSIDPLPNGNPQITKRWIAIPPALYVKLICAWQLQEVK